MRPTPRRLRLLVTLTIAHERDEITEDVFKAELDKIARELGNKQFGAPPVHAYPDLVPYRVSRAVELAARKLQAEGAYTTDAGWLTASGRPVRAVVVEPSHEEKGVAGMLRGFLILSENYNKESYSRNSSAGPRDVVATGRKVGEVYMVATTTQGRKPYDSQEEAEQVATALLRNDETPPSMWRRS